MLHSFSRDTLKVQKSLVALAVLVCLNNLHAPVRQWSEGEDIASRQVHEVPIILVSGVYVVEVKDICFVQKGRNAATVDKE